MLRDLKDLEGLSIEASDGDIGTVNDFYFDDEQWVLRYLTVETGSWLFGRPVLISPWGLDVPTWGKSSIPSRMTRAQVSGSPAIERDRPVSRQHEMRYADYYGYANYWGGTSLWGSGLYPYSGAAGNGEHGPAYRTEMLAEQEYRRDLGTRGHGDDPHLRSLNEVRGYHIHAADGAIGHLRTLLIDDRNWAIRYAVVDTSNWWLGHQVLIAPQWIDRVDWAQRELHTELTLAEIKAAPGYESVAKTDRDLESNLHSHYRRIGYWPTAQDLPSRAQPD